MIADSAVDFPEPEGPMIVSTSPPAIRAVWLTITWP